MYKALLEEVLTDWTEEELMKCEDKENFALFWISRLFDSNFSRKPQKSCALTPFSPTGPPPAAISVAPAPHTSPSTTPGLLAPAPANTLLYPTHTLGIGLIPGVYMQPPGIGPTSGAYMQFLSTEPLLVVYT